MITPQMPYPPHQGTSLRNYHILRGLAERHLVTLLSYADTGAAQQGQIPEALLDVCTAVHLVQAPSRSTQERLWQFVNSDEPDMALRLRSQALATKLRTMLASRPYDIVQVEGLELAWLIPLVRSASPESRIVFDAHNAETILQRRAGEADRRNPRRWPAAAYSAVQSRRLARYERRTLQGADWTTAVSEPDAKALRAVAGKETPLSVIPNSIDVASYATLASGAGDEAPSYDVVFSGKMDYRPNVDAVLWFAEAVWPLIRRARPQTTWAIVGQKPHARLARLQDAPGITLTGWVQDVKPYLAQAGVFIMPFRVGSGTRLKLIEAMASQLAVVSTSVGAEGFAVQDGEQLLLADEPAGFAAAVLAVLADPALRTVLGTNGQRFATQYDWRVVIPRFDVIYETLWPSGTMAGGPEEAAP